MTSSLSAWPRRRSTLRMRLRSSCMTRLCALLISRLTARSWSCIFCFSSKLAKARAFASSSMSFTLKLLRRSLSSTCCCSSGEISASGTSMSSRGFSSGSPSGLRRRASATVRMSESRGSLRLRSFLAAELIMTAVSSRRFSSLTVTTLRTARSPEPGTKGRMPAWRVLPSSPAVVAAYSMSTSTSMRVSTPRLILPWRPSARTLRWLTMMPRP
mmetsp:Transcript_40131/g.125650  ORF Transcript_40131/g.125650 Transcript_40131/m.125650 type:complete len:214 (-) Transcript_40131:469-1110(-)